MEAIGTWPRSPSQTITAMETTKVSGLSLAGPSSKIYEMIRGKKDLSKLVQVKVEENHVSIGITVLVEYGLNIYQVSRELQRRVKNAVESMTGKIVEHVNVTVNGIIMPPALKDEEPPPKALPEKKDDSK